MGNAKDRPGGARRVKEPEWEMGRIDRVKNWSGKWEGPGGGAGGGFYGVYNSPVHYGRGPH